MASGASSCSTPTPRFLSFGSVPPHRLLASSGYREKRKLPMPTTTRPNVRRCVFSVTQREG
ncbi:hypothetical protein E2562_016016 [Oryza meyeriana var. granulata]|uniref:Uncharacterized protein n=1 Tax=Oryza meyeriana var. granulata TaxID=110450 RepID=A0A6G1EM32_9ORYZ|nr:hypothetical protein E2562_016016 [Oryza meyeriana var. granulata]